MLKTGLKVAVAVKTADVIHERILARQEQHAAAQERTGPTATAVQPAPVALTGEKLAQLKLLGELRASGVLTDPEFEVQKAQILGA
jgi:hypothetical protein